MLKRLGRGSRRFHVENRTRNDIILPFTEISMTYISEKIEAAILEYNRYRVYLVQAELRELDEPGFSVFFDGSFCETCGYYDYYEDLQVLLEDEYGINSRIVDITHLEKGDLVRFSLFSDDTELDS